MHLTPPRPHLRRLRPWLPTCCHAAAFSTHRHLLTLPFPFLAGSESGRPGPVKSSQSGDAAAAAAAAADADAAAAAAAAVAAERKAALEAAAWAQKANTCHDESALRSALSGGGGGGVPPPGGDAAEYSPTKDPLNAVAIDGDGHYYRSAYVQHGNTEATTVEVRLETRTQHPSRSFARSPSLTRELRNIFSFRIRTHCFIVLMALAPLALSYMALPSALWRSIIRTKLVAQQL